MFKCINGQAPSYLCDKFKQGNQIHRSTRSNEELDIPKFRSSTGEQLLSIEVQNYGMNLIKGQN
mgnify:FL=1